MHIQKVISKKTFKHTNYFFVGNLSRIRIHWSEAWIRGSRSGSTPKCHGSATLDFPRHVKKPWRGEKYRKMSTYRMTAAHSHSCSHPEALLKGTVQWELRWVKIGINRSIMMFSLAGKCPIFCPKGHHHERSINVLSDCNTF